LCGGLSTPNGDITTALEEGAAMSPLSLALLLLLLLLYFRRGSNA
jgi:hypothetical protein